MAKKLSPLVWVGIGCAGLIVVGMIAAGVFVYWVKGKAEDYVAEAEKNPTLAAAKLLAAADPDLEIVSSDDQAQTVTFKNNKTGETATVNLEQIQQGKISFTTNEGTTSFSADQGTATFTGPDGQKSTWGDGAELPNWVPAYSGTTPVGVANVNSQENMGGMFTMETPDAADKVIDWYKAKLAGAGFKETASNSSSSSGTAMQILSMSSAAQSQDITVTVMTSPDEPGTKISVNYNMSK
jgi:hypothetical protein